MPGPPGSRSRSLWRRTSPRSLRPRGAACSTRLEVNTSGLRQAPLETYPAEPVVARYRELGGRRVSAGSDAHRADWFAAGLAEGYRIVAEAGFDELAFRRGAERVAIALPARFALA